MHWLIAETEAALGGAFIGAMAEVDIGLERFVQTDDCDASSSGASTCRSW
ncbi:hypothetical protein [Streptomyces himalayensis]|uniref:Uncharacterized protein n=1 Tax=Streptomyces himalayensis subsp. himalayensis TaxID=2756131 RepID=A0A7W0IDG6_9ACTN|nr:hypothetical protein [Streptomyces himalayensis]MBA2951272.1 hypothetical protein [Streptomyces himalayensis subsp. himalayensis]